MIEHHPLPGDPPTELALWHNGEPGRQPLVVIAHGLGGSHLDLAATAEAISDTGIAVIAPRHAMDSQFAGPAYPVALRNRALEVQRAVEWAHDTQAERIDAERLGLFGYSQGGLSVMVAAGANPQRRLARDHCRANRWSDLGFCGPAPPSWWQRLMRGLGLAEDDEPGPDAPLPDALQPRAIAVAAPVAAMVSADDMRALPGRLAVLSFGADRVLSAHHHSDAIHRALGEREHVYHRFEQASHGAPFDPAYRPAINAALVDFFTESLR